MTINNRLDRTFGVVLFDNIFEFETGWAYASGKGNSVRRIRKFEDLPSDTIWWSNIPTELFHASMNCSFPPCLRHVNYLFIKPNDMLREWGLLKSVPEQMENPANRCIVLADAFSSIMTLAFDLIKQSTDVSAISKVFTAGTLIEDLKQLLPATYEPVMPEKGNRYTKPNSNKRFNDRVRPVAELHYFHTRVNRFFHTRRMLRFQIPDLSSRFDHIPDSLIREKQSRLEGLEGHLSQMEYPAMTDIIIEDSKNKFVSLYGMSTEHETRYRQNMHNWIALLEFLRTSNESKMSVQGIYLCTKTTSFMEDLSDPLKDFFNDDCMGCSWSAGILAESLWYAATYKQSQLKSHMFDRKGNFPQTSWQSEWVLGANEASMVDDKRKFGESGYYAASYGPGWAKVGVYEDYVKDLIVDSIGFGYLPDLTKLQKKYYVKLDRSIWGGDEFSFLLAHSQFTANSTLMRKLDSVAFIPSSQRLQYLEELKMEFGILDS